jgi:COP9 signalosome complex subunit 1
VPTIPRSRLHADALNTAKEYEREARRRVQHMNIAGGDLEVKGKGRGGNGFDLDDSFGGGRTLRSHQNF